MSDFISRYCGASSHTNDERQPLDYYATHPAETQRILDKEKFNKSILEPCCGQGHMAKVLKENGYCVKASDVADYGYGEIKNFFDIKSFDGDIITNPPYKIAEKIIKHALDITNNGNKVAMLLRIQFLESRKRQPLFKKYPPKYVYVATERMKISKNADFERYGSSTCCYAWFIWEKGFKGEPILRWC